MFLTITIDTKNKNKKSVRMRKQKLNPLNGWRKSINTKKRSVWQKIRGKIRIWKKSWKNSHYNMDGQPVMF